MKKIYLILFPALLLFSPFFVKAAVCDLNTTLDFVARDPDGSYIAKANVEIYKQEKDANGLAKPTTRLAGGVTDSVLGNAHLTWRNSNFASDTYAVKVNTVNSTNASFWYFNVPLNCGSTTSLSKTLSGILFIMHDMNGNLLTNTNFSIYSQNYASGKVLEQKKEMLATLNSGVNGQVKVYLPQGSVRSINLSYSDHYELDLTRGSSKFSYFGIKVIDSQLTTMNYYISSFKIKLQDISGASYPANTKVEVYKQGVASNNDHQKGDKVGEFLLASDGSGTFETAAGLYVIGIKGINNQYQYFWDIQVDDGHSSEYTLTSEQNSNISTGTCPNTSQLTITLRNVSGDITPGLKFELYEQKSDANNMPYAGTRINSGTIDSSGRAILNFKPDPRMNYALKVWDKNTNLGDYWFYDAVRFVCDYNRAITKTIPSLKVILRDRAGVLKRNYNFSLYAQKFDVDLKPMFESSDLVASLKTDGGGSALVYVAPYNAYRRGQSGVYALSTKDASGNTVNVYDINISNEKDYTFNYILNGLKGRLLDSAKNPMINKNISLYEIIGSDADKTLGRQLLKSKTDASGNFSFDYPYGTYALVYGDQIGANNIFWNVVSNNTNKVLTLTANANSSVTISTPSKPSLPTAPSKPETNSPSSVAPSNSLKGRILLQVQDKGQAWYISPVNNKRYYLGRPADAFNIMRKLGLGISNKNFDALQVTSNRKLAGRILIKVEDSGRAYYYNPLNMKLYYLGRPDDAFKIIRSLGLGITNSNLGKISVSN